MVSRLVDRGNEFMDVWVTVVATDRDGNRVRVPSDKPYRVRVTVAEDRQSDAELAGQVTTKVVRVVMRQAPDLDSWAAVRFRGEYWDLASPPHFSNGVSRAVKHVEVLLRSRNNIPSVGVGAGG